MPSFVLLLHEHPEDYADMSPTDMQAIVQRYQAWSQGLAAEGRLLRGDKLTDDAGRQLARVAGRTVITDGPYAEAERIAADCPHLGRKRNRIELRQIDDLA